MNIRSAINTAIGMFTAAAVPSPRMNAELLLMFTLGCDRSYLHAHPERELTEDEVARYNLALGERARGMPTQYITGHQEFWGLDFIVTPAVLIPRPETEHVIEAVLDCSWGPSPAGIKLGGLHPGTTLRIVDVGTGSGCIAVALAKEFPQSEIHATEISPAAIEMARTNAARHQVENRIKFHQTDLLEGVLSAYFDFVVSNPPYVGESEEDHVQLEVRKFEPRHAIFAGPTGLEIIERLIPQAEVALKPAGFLIMEISGTIAEEVKDLLSSWMEVRLKNDLQGIPRVAIAQKK
jgi:release factor glutamine methyltransferase